MDKDISSYFLKKILPGLDSIDHVTLLNGEDLKIGLIDHGLFSEKMPTCFTSIGLSNLKSNWARDQITKRTKERDYIRYTALRDIPIPREMGIPHPEPYIIQAMFLSEHWKEIFTHCNRPKPKASQIHVKNLFDGRIFNMNYTAHDNEYHPEIETLRETATYCCYADISNFFRSIYTHSISWALHGKEFSKKNKRDTKGAIIDRLTRNIKDAETNGILIGPVSSNVISEIILTTIDYNLQESGFVNFIRYIDDYHFFCKSRKEGNDFIRRLDQELKSFDLALNTNKIKIEENRYKESWTKTLKIESKRAINSTSAYKYIDSALNIAKKEKTDAPISYALKTLSSKHICRYSKKDIFRFWLKITEKKPYLSRFLHQYGIVNLRNRDTKLLLIRFINSITHIWIRDNATEAISQLIYISVKENIGKTVLSELQTCQSIIKTKDCILICLLWEYARKFKLVSFQREITKFLIENENDKYWLLLYLVYDINKLEGIGQGFLADLKKSNFEFINFS
ncbi:MAG: RNA-directed DNA polymerase [Opitutales bacterium]|nr:RNA-directed DNA polymerase [Opitutales bacterium]